MPGVPPLALTERFVCIRKPTRQTAATTRNAGDREQTPDRRSGAGSWMAWQLPQGDAIIAWLKRQMLFTYGSRASCWQGRCRWSTTLSTVKELAAYPADSGKLAARYNLVEIAEACRREADVGTMDDLHVLT